jgi:uncharacterized membrane-anchored protein YjiN (DUF445 family)
MTNDYLTMASKATPDQSIRKLGAEAKRATLKRMQWLALTLLLSMLALLALSAAYRSAYPWLHWVHAFAEAAAVGATADWFAVTALFRRPLRLPIPHTAIIPKNKDRIGASLGNFVEHNFLTPTNVIRKLARQNLSHAAAGWLANPEHSKDVARRVCSLIPGILEAIEDEDVRRFFDQAIVPKLNRLNVAHIAGEVLDVLTAKDRHQGLLDQGFKALEAWLATNRAVIKAKFGEASKYTPGFFDSYVVNRFVDGIIALLHEVAQNAQHEIRLRFDQATREFIHKLKVSPEYRQRSETLKHDLLEHVKREHYYRQIWIELKSRIIADVASERSLICEHVAGALDTAAYALLADQALQRKLNGWALGALERLMLAHRHQISLLIAEVAKSWDARDVSEKVELEIGKDLQYIRINGTLVGGTVGVMLHAFASMVS